VHVPCQHMSAYSTMQQTDDFEDSIASMVDYSNFCPLIKIAILFVLSIYSHYSCHLYDCP